MLLFPVSITYNDYYLHKKRNYLSLNVFFLIVSSKGNTKDLKQCLFEINLDGIPTDPELRIRILDYNPNIRDQVRRTYLQKGPCQPKKHNFPSKKFRELSQRFNLAWFTDYDNWLEYSIAKDAAFCLCCYLFKPYIREQADIDSLVSEGFSNWKKKKIQYSCWWPL